MRLTARELQQQKEKNGRIKGEIMGKIMATADVSPSFFALRLLCALSLEKKENKREGKRKSVSKMRVGRKENKMKLRLLFRDINFNPLITLSIKGKQR